MQRFHQLGYVTNALDRARRIFADLHGVRHFRESERIVAGRRFGVSGNAVLRVALANTPGAQIELIQPVSSQIDVFTDYLPATGFTLRLHHVAFRIDGTADDWQRQLQLLENSGRQIARQSAPSPAGEFAYTDDRDSLCHFVEYLWSTPERWEQMMQSVPFN